MRRPHNPPHSSATDADDRPHEFDTDAAEERGEPIGAARHVARGGPENGEADGATTDGEYGPGSD